MQRGTLDIVVLVAAIIVIVPLIVFWAIALADLANRPDWEFPPSYQGPNQRIFWIFVVLFLNVVGATIYYVNVMKPYPRNRR
ncbi:MAG: hypothetical protein HGA54_05095 [Actinobacteria bacterium]|nr:hypothetical protein [Actinomycetota bacterium]